MGKVTAGGTMSLDGYIAGPEESGFDLLFQWYGNGDVEIPSASPGVPAPHISAASATLIKPEWENTGALVVGRHLYDMTNAWGGRHPMGVTTVVLTHRRPDDRPEDDENFGVTLCAKDVAPTYQLVAQLRMIEDFTGRSDDDLTVFIGDRLAGPIRISNRQPHVCETDSTACVEPVPVGPTMTDCRGHATERVHGYSGRVVAGDAGYAAHGSLSLIRGRMPVIGERWDEERARSLRSRISRAGGPSECKLGTHQSGPGANLRPAF